MFLIFQGCYSQSKNKIATSEFIFKTSLSMGAIYPIEFGKTALSEAHSSNIGFTATVGLIQYSGFTAGLGFDHVRYNVDDTQIIGVYESSIHNSYFITLNYEYPLTDKFSLTPSIGYGESNLAIRKGDKNRGSQDGKEFRLGSSLNYNFNDHNAICFSLLYVNNNYIVNANETVKDYFKKSNSIQLAIVYRIR